jgi:hypothetical protein
MEDSIGGEIGLVVWIEGIGEPIWKHGSKREYQIGRHQDQRAPRPDERHRFERATDAKHAPKTNSNCQQNGLMYQTP